MSGSLSPRFAQLSLVSLLATIAATGVHHIFRLGPELIVPTVIAFALGASLWYLHRRTGRAGFLMAYAVFAALIVFWFGFLDGFLDHVVKAAGLDNITFLPGSEAAVVATAFQLWSQDASSAFYEWTGIVSAVLSLPTVVFTTAYLANGLAPAMPRAAE